MALKALKLKRIDHTQLNRRQKESYSFQKVSALLADYGFTTIQLKDDWYSANFLAQNIVGQTYLKVVLKSRLAFHKKYLHKDIYMCFPNGKDWYFFHHDELLGIFSEKNDSGMADSKSWAEEGSYSFPSLSKEDLQLFEDYKL